MVQELLYTCLRAYIREWPPGLMDKALPSGGKDSEFESWGGRDFFIFSKNLLLHFFYQVIPEDHF